MNERNTDSNLERPSRRHLLGATAALGLAATTASAQIGKESLRPAQLGTESIGKTPHTRFAPNIEMWWGKFPFVERMRQAHAHGFSGVEFWNWRSKDLAAVKAVREELSLTIAQFTAWGFRPGLNDPANKNAFAQAIEEACVTAHEWQCKKATVVAGDLREGVALEEQLDSVRDALKHVAPIAEANDVMLILEPMNERVDHPGHCLIGSQDALRICREVDSSHVKINWDLYHMQISEGDLCGHLREGYDQIGYVQLADHPGRHEPGTGEIYYPRVLQELHKLGYRDFVGLECSPKDGDDLRAAMAVAAADRFEV